MHKHALAVAAHPAAHHTGYAVGLVIVVLIFAFVMWRWGKRSDARKAARRSNISS
jgi:hypothetical protein